MQDYAQYVGQRVLLRCRSNLSYVGNVKQLVSSGGIDSMLLELDEASRFALVCPIAFINTIRPLGAT